LEGSLGKGIVSQRYKLKYDKLVSMQDQKVRMGIGHFGKGKNKLKNFFQSHMQKKRQ